MSYTKEKIEAMKIAKGYKVGEPALVSFEVLINLIEEKNLSLDEVQELNEENKFLREQIKKEKKEKKEIAFLLKETKNDLMYLEKEIDIANHKASKFLAADLNRKTKRKEIQLKKLFTHAELLLGAYNE